MIHRSFGARRRRDLLAGALFGALALGAGIESCDTYRPFPKGISSFDGLRPASGTAIGAECVQKAGTIVRSLGVTDQTELLHGWPSNCPPGQFSDIFSTPGVPGKGVDGIKFRDGPRGVCLAADLRSGASGYSTVFPAAPARAASFDYDLEEKIGEDIGDEMVA